MWEIIVINNLTWLKGLDSIISINEISNLLLMEAKQKDMECICSITSCCHFDLLFQRDVCVCDRERCPSDRGKNFENPSVIK